MGSVGLLKFRPALTVLYKMAQSELSNVWLTVCARSSDPLCIVSYYVKWATTSWTDSTI